MLQYQVLLLDYVARTDPYADVPAMPVHVLSHPPLLYRDAKAAVAAALPADEAAIPHRKNMYAAFVYSCAMQKRALMYSCRTEPEKVPSLTDVEGDVISIVGAARNVGEIETRYRAKKRRLYPEEIDVEEEEDDEENEDDNESEEEAEPVQEAEQASDDARGEGGAPNGELPDNVAANDGAEGMEHEKELVADADGAEEALQRPQSPGAMPSDPTTEAVQTVVSSKAKRAQSPQLNRRNQTPVKETQQDRNASRKRLRPAPVETIDPSVTKRQRLLQSRNIYATQRSDLIPAWTFPIDTARLPFVAPNMSLDDIFRTAYEHIRQEGVFRDFESQTASVAVLDPSRPFIVRLDGRAFSSFTKGLKLPHDPQFRDVLLRTAADLLLEFLPTTVYHTSDELSLLFDAAPPVAPSANPNSRPSSRHPPSQTESSRSMSPLPDSQSASASTPTVSSLADNATAPPVIPNSAIATGGIKFGGRVQKLVSTIASFAGARFHWHMAAMDWSAYAPDVQERLLSSQAHFDARVLSVSSVADLVDYVAWRQADGIRNAVNIMARTIFSADDLMGRSMREVVRMCEQRGLSYMQQPEWFRFGTVLKRRRVFAGQNQNVPRAADPVGRCVIVRQCPEWVEFVRKKTEDVYVQQ